MTTALSNADLLKALFNALPDSAIGGVSDEAHYVNRASDVSVDSVADLTQFIEWAPQSNETYLFSGLRGAGKTTELNRLVRELRAKGVAAYYCDASTYLNLNDPKLSLPELLMTALAGMSDAVRKELGGKDFLSDSIWQRTKRLLKSNLEIKPTLKLGGDEAGIEVEATLQENPDFRKELIEYAKSNTEFYAEAAKFADELTELVRRRTQCQKVVLVVDSLERLSAPTGDEKDLFDSLKQIFFNEPSRLRFPGLSVVYSAPPYLNAVLPGVSGGFSQSVSLANFKVMNRPLLDQTPTRNAEGIAMLVLIIEQRFADWRLLLTQEVLEELAWLSGGNVRRFFALVRGTARKAGLTRAPLPLDDTRQGPVLMAVSDAAQPLQWLNAEDRRWLGHFLNGSKSAAAYIEDLAKDLPAIIRLFDHSLVLDYRNGEMWYQVPPLVRPHVN
jgi:hypothetical protein